MKNPNEYNIDAFADASDEAIGPIQDMWNAGAGARDIAAVVKDALEGVRANDGKGVRVVVKGES